MIGINFRQRDWVEIEIFEFQICKSKVSIPRRIGLGLRFGWMLTMFVVWCVLRKELELLEPLMSKAKGKIVFPEWGNRVSSRTLHLGL